MIKMIKPDFVHEDDRGRLVQMVHKGWHQINVITSKAGVVRGGHYHKLNQELFFIVSGRVLVRVRKEGKEEEHLFIEGDMFVIEEYVKHDFIFEEETVLVSMYSGCVEMDGGKMDIYIAD